MPRTSTFSRPPSRVRMNGWFHDLYYGAFVCDPDGDQVEAVCDAPAED